MMALIPPMNPHHRLILNRALDSYLDTATHLTPSAHKNLEIEVAFIRRTLGLSP